MITDSYDIETEPVISLRDFYGEPKHQRGKRGRRRTRAPRRAVIDRITRLIAGDAERIEQRLHRAGTKHACHVAKSDGKKRQTVKTG